MASVLLTKAMKYRRQLVMTGLGVSGWIAFKYLPSSKFISNSGFLLYATERHAQREVERLRGLGFNIPRDENKLYQIQQRIPQAVIEQAVIDINKSRIDPLDLSKVNFASSVAVHVGCEYHSGSLKNGGFIVLPGTFGLTKNEKSIYMNAKHFNAASVIFSLLDTNTWKFMIAKELLYLEDERYMMKFSMYLGSFLICASYVTVINAYRFLNSSPVIDRLAHFFVNRKESVFNATSVHKRVKAASRSLLYGSIGCAFALSYVIYKLCLYQYCCSKTRKLDKTLAELGQDYVQGGKDYFDKILDAGYFQHHMLNNKQFNKLGNKETRRFLFVIPKTLTREQRYEFYSKLCDP